MSIFPCQLDINPLFSTTLVILTIVYCQIPFATISLIQGSSLPSIGPSKPQQPLVPSKPSMSVAPFTHIANPILPSIKIASIPSTTSLVTSDLFFSLLINLVNH